MNLDQYEENPQYLRKKVLTWHVHGSYLYYLTQTPHEFYLPVRGDRSEGYGGLGGGLSWGPNVHEIDVDQVSNLDLDCIIFQSRQNYLKDQYEILSPFQREIPRIYLEHDPPREHPTDTRHIVDDPEILLVHVTPFNRLMWDNGRTPTCVIEHGVVTPPNLVYSGEFDRGIVVVNNLKQRGRRLGADIFLEARQQVPLDLYGISADQLGGQGNLGLFELHELEIYYRFFFNPIRYTSLGLAVCEAMMLGLPILGLATTEMATAIVNGVNGFVDTSPDRLIDWMKELIADRILASELSAGAYQIARERFGIERFARDWDRVIRLATEHSSAAAAI